MRRKSIIFFITWCLAMATFAIPAKRVAVRLEQPDGTSITAYLCGDEHCHFYVNENDKMIIEGEDGFYRIATADEEAAICNRWQEKIELNNMRRAKRTEDKRAETRLRNSELRNSGFGNYGFGNSSLGNSELQNNSSRGRKAFAQRGDYIGQKRGLVILVNFLNLSMKTPNAEVAFDEQFNKVGYSENEHIGSVHDYFYDQSYGQFDLTFDIVGPVRVSKEYSFYGKNDSNGDDMYPGMMVIEACQLADEYVDFSRYDWDGDGEVDQVVIIYAGYGEHAGAARSTIWPHEYELDLAKEFGDGDGAITLDGTRINSYAVSCELSGHTGSIIDGIGTACHEFSHCLGLPDLYDTTGSASGMGDWDLMAAGSYNGPFWSSEVPCGFSAYEREFAGWVNIRELSSPCTVSEMPSLNDEGVAYAIYNDGNRNEFFVLENRQNDRWFEYVGMTEGIHGMLVTHIDYDKEAWQENEVNTSATHQRVAYIPCNGTHASSRGVLFPNRTDKLTNDSHQNCGGTLFNPNVDGSFFMNKEITDIKETDGLISFQFMGGGEDVGIGNTEAEHAEKAEMAEYYNLSGIRTKEPKQRGVYLERRNGVTIKIAR